MCHDQRGLTGSDPAGQNLIAGHLDVCLCLSVLPGFLDSHPVAKKVVDGVGRDGARDYFSGLVSKPFFALTHIIPNFVFFQVQNQNGKQECHYPAHAHPFCSISSPCGFTCDNGYTASPSTNPTDCICKSPYSECNGVCGYFPRGCGSQALSKRKRDYPTCSAGKTICGVPNGGKGYDCVDIKSDVESCKCFCSRCAHCDTKDMVSGGGCTVASPFGNNVADGKNCKSIPHVEKVLCDNGSCKVQSCKRGYKVSRSEDSCVQPRLDRIRQVPDVQVPTDVDSLQIPTDVDSLLALIEQQRLFIEGFDLDAAKEKLDVVLETFDVDSALEVLLIEKAFIEAYVLAQLKARLGIA